MSEISKFEVESIHINKLSKPQMIDYQSDSHNFSEFQKQFLQEKNLIQESNVSFVSKEEKQNSVCLKTTKFSEEKAKDPQKINCDKNSKVSYFLKILAKKFVTQLKKNANLNEAILSKPVELVNDLSHSQILKKNTSNRNGKLNKIFVTLKKLILFLVKNQTTTQLFKNLKKMGIIHPFEKAKIFWDILLFMNTLLMFFYVPFTLSFEIINEVKWNIFHFLQFIIYLIDMIISLNTSYIDKGVLVKEKISVLNNYLYGFFIFDSIAILSLFARDYESSNDPKLIFFQLLIFCLFPSFRQKFERIKEYLSLSHRLKGILDLIVLLIISLFFSHLFACIFHLIANFNPPAKNWLSYYNLDKNSKLEKYLYSLYWSTVTIMTVGYGDITPQNPREILFTVFAVFGGCIVFGYNLNKIASVFQDMNQENSKMQHSMNKINRFMESKNINSNLQMRVRAYLKFISEHQNKDLNPEVLDIISKLSDPLKQELYLEGYGKIFRTFPLLSEYYSEKFLCSLIKCVEEETFMKNEIIFNEKEEKNRNLYFVVEGEISIFNNLDQSNGLILKKIHEKEFLGEFSFLTGLTHKSSAKALKYTKLYKISHLNFLKILKIFPRDYEKYCEIRDKIILSQEYSNFDLRCHVCNKKDHLTETCRLVHFVPNKEAIILRYVFSKDQERKNFERKNKKNNSLAIKKKITDAKITKYQLTESLEAIIGDSYSFISDEISEEGTNDRKDPIESLNSFKKDPSLQTLPALKSKTQLTIEKDHHVKVMKNQSSLEEAKRKSTITKESLKTMASSVKFSENSLENVKSFEFYYREANVADFLKRYKKFQKLIKNSIRKKKLKGKEKELRKKSGYGFLNPEQMINSVNTSSFPQENTQKRKNLGPNKGFFSITPTKWNFLELVSRTQKSQKKKIGKKIDD